MKCIFTFMQSNVTNFVCFCGCEYDAVIHVLGDEDERAAYVKCSVFQVVRITDG